MKDDTQMERELPRTYGGKKGLTDAFPLSAEDTISFYGLLLLLHGRSVPETGRPASRAIDPWISRHQRETAVTGTDCQRARLLLLSAE